MIDDDNDLAEVMRAVLEKEGFLFEYASSASLGLAALERARPDLILLDIVMEDVFAGFRVIAALRRSPDPATRARWATVPIVLMSGIQKVTGMQVLQDAPEALLPIDTCIEKPNSPAIVIEAIRGCLARARAGT